MLRDDHFAELPRGERLAFGLNQNPLGRRFDEARAANTTRLARRAQHVLHGEVESDQSLRPHLNLQLAHLAAKDRDPRHARHRQQTRAHRPIDERSQLHRREFLRHQAELQQVHRGRRERGHPGGFHADRQFTRGRRQLLGQHLARDVDVSAFFEHRRSHGESLD